MVCLWIRKYKKVNTVKQIEKKVLHNLPAQLTTFIGREKEMETVKVQVIQVHRDGPIPVELLGEENVFLAKSLQSIRDKVEDPGPVFEGVGFIAPRVYVGTQIYRW